MSWFFRSGFFEIIFASFWVIFIGMFLFVIIYNLRQWNKNNNSPRLTVEAQVASKRTQVSHHDHPVAGDITGAHGYHSSSSTSYYATFQVESGDRMEFSVSGSEYGMLMEGDQGRLTFQGTRYLGFERTR